MPRDTLSKVSLPPTDMALNSQADIKHPRIAKAKLATPSLSAEETLHRVAADATILAMIGAKHSLEEVPSPNQA